MLIEEKRKRGRPRKQPSLDVQISEGKVEVVKIPYESREAQRAIHAMVESSRFSVVVAHRRLGKTVCMITQLIKAAMTDKSGSGRYGYIAPYRNQAKSIAWDYLKHFSMNIPLRIVNEGDLSIDFPSTGARIRLFGADNADAIRGLYFDGVVLDEVADMRPDVWGEIVRPTLSDRNGWACFIGTPRGQNLFYELYMRGQSGTKDWKSILFRADETGILPKNELESARAAMSENQFKQEFLCDFSASVDNILIPIDIVALSAGRVYLDDESDFGAKVMGVDVARYGNDRSAICKRQGLRCCPIRAINHMDNMTFAGIVAEEINAFKPDAVFVDAGRGEGVIDRLRQLRYQVMEINFGGRALDPKKYENRRVEMWDKMREWIVQGGAIPNDNELKSELSSPTYMFDAHGRKVLESKEKIKERGLRSPDLADSLALTFAAAVASRDVQERFSQGYDDMPIFGRL
jgi:hypothetical protein